MASEFLHSSPSKDENDDHRKLSLSTQTPLRNKISTIPLTKSSSKQQQQQYPQQQQPIQYPPSASKYINQSLNLTGWTPLISKTYSNEQILSFNSTPNKLLLQTTNSLSGSNSINDLDFQGFGLTPFLNHNLNILGSATSNHQGNTTFTPYHEKIFQSNNNATNDFFIESPIRFGSNLNDIQAITPSKFSLNSVANKKILQDPMKSATKRSIALLDTPPRQPHKLSITTKAEKEDHKPENDDEDEDEDDAESNKENIPPHEKKELLQTPSKVIRTKSKPQFQTPAKQQIPAPSSPSTIIISSPTKNGDESIQRRKPIDKENDPPMPPPSPTPAKNIPVKPIMGVFTERKSTMPLQDSTNTYKSNSKSMNQKLSLSTNNTNNKSKSKSKNKLHQQEFQQSQFKGTETKTKATNKAKMQAGMNKFQIVLTDVHNLVNNKKKTTKSEGKSRSKSPEKKQSKQQQQQQQVPKLNQQSSSLQDNTMNTSKEHSSMMSGGGNNSMNTSHLNLTTDHSSFELGGLSSTPNSKFLLDKIFEKPSPQSNFFIHQQQHQQHISLPQQQQQQQNLPHIIPQQQQQILTQTNDGSMPPPLPGNNSSKQNMAFASQQIPVMNMTMSTPQHQSVINYSPQMYNGTSPDLYNFGTTPQGVSVYQHNNPNNVQFHQQQQRHQYDDNTE
ncbi:hypothetical protein G210_2189 [Candida maltosa Xu316]|uniref:Uncharacterized protein n=1 Tax=Candida maltosa (strain Xu316) TaxID=1245528 RepID=M3IVC6_CANMX|nr:hypothetical protein G210_2189 [Candida maltosa Xu316]